MVIKKYKIVEHIGGMISTKQILGLEEIRSFCAANYVAGLLYADKVSMIPRGDAEHYYVSVEKDSEYIVLHTTEGEIGEEHDIERFIEKQPITG